MSEKGLKVSSGAFRVDRARALEKLQNFALEDSWAFVLCFIRCAVASGATRILLRRAPRQHGREGLEVRFDGLPFRRAELEAPYDALLDGREGAGRRERYLAVGLLTAFRLKPDSARVISGRGTERVELAARTALEESVSPHPERDHDTIVRVLWAKKPKELEAVRGLIRRRCDGCPAPIEMGLGPRELVDPLDGDEDGLIVSRDGFRAVAHCSPSGLSALQLSVDGVTVHGETLELPLPVDVIVEHGRLALDASQRSVVRDGRWAEAVKFAETAAYEVFEAALRRHRERGPEIERLLVHPTVRSLWRDVFDRPGSTIDSWKVNRDVLDGLRGFAHSLRRGAPRKGALQEIWRDARRVRWLRRAASTRVRPGDPTPATVRERLGREPLFLSRDGDWLCAEDLRAAMRAEGAVAYVWRRDEKPVRRSRRALWLSGPAEMGTVYDLAPDLKLVYAGSGGPP